jgi:hypothetical protein
MKLPVAILAVGTALPLLGAAGPDSRSGSLERAFAAGGEVQLELSAGDYVVEGTTEHKIWAEWRVKEARHLASVEAKADVSGSRARLRIEGPRNDFKVVIRVPARSDLRIDLSAGDLRIQGVEGNKDIDVYAGDVDVELGRAEDYKRVEASIWAGDLRAAPLRVSKGGLFRSFKWNGEGRYRLRAHLGAGDLTLY